MRAILVVARHHLFPDLSPQGFLPAGAVALKTSRSRFADSNVWPQIIAMTSLIACLNRLRKTMGRRLP